MRHVRRMTVRCLGCGCGFRYAAERNANGRAFCETCETSRGPRVFSSAAYTRRADGSVVFSRADGTFTATLPPPRYGLLTAADGVTVRVFPTAAAAEAALAARLDDAHGN